MNALEILNNNGLKRTSCREGIINVIMSANQGLSESEIRERLEGNYDRTTFYRSFKTLEDHKIIHKIVVDNQLVKYALGNSFSQFNDHAHFYCSECNEVKCMENIPVQKYSLPEGFLYTETEVLIKGRCSKCHCK